MKSPEYQVPPTEILIVKEHAVWVEYRFISLNSIIITLPGKVIPFMVDKLSWKILMSHAVQIELVNYKTKHIFLWLSNEHFQFKLFQSPGAYRWETAKLVINSRNIYYITLLLKYQLTEIVQGSLISLIV